MAVVLNRKACQRVPEECVEQTHLLYDCHGVSIEFGISFFTRSFKVHCINVRVGSSKLRSNSIGDLIFKESRT